MRFLSFIRSSESYRNQQPPAALMQAMGPFVEKWKREGVLVDTGGLLPSKEGVRIRSHGGKLSITDGPFAETKEVIGGWAILEAPTKEAALVVAKEFMDLHAKHWPEFDCESELRPMFDPNMGPR